MILLWIANIFLIVLIAYLLFKTLNIPETRPCFLPALVFKIIAGIAVGVIYKYYYHFGDTLRFNELSVNLHDWGISHFGQYISFILSGKISGIIPLPADLTEEPRTLFFVKFLSLVNFLSDGNYWINSLYLSNLSFIGTWLIVKEVTRLNKNLLLPVLISFAFMPTIVFWSSGVLKESLAMLSMGMIIYIFLIYFRTNRIKPFQAILFLFGVWIYWDIKYYMAAVMITAMLSVIIASQIKLKNVSIPGQALVIISYIFLILAATFIHPNFSLNRIFNLLNENHMRMLELSQYRNIVPFFPVSDPQWRFLLNLPVALFAGLFMPLPFQGNGIIIFLPGIINFFILLSSGLLLSGKIVCPSGKMRLLLTGMVLYVITLAVMLSYSTPNFGTLERYKVSYLPVYLLLILAGLWPRISGSFGMISKIRYNKP